MGQHEEILRACYGRSGRSGELYSWGRRLSPEEARTIYYRVYGQPFNSVPPPKLYAGRARWDVMEQEFTWDNDQGGEAVAGRVRGLSLLSSRQDGFVDPEAALAYLEWTLEFKNVSALQREARAQVALPPGAVVSRLTLWIDGEEREAAFGGRSQVRTAYKEVVQRKRDPVLVTTCGPDRVLVQCFPVPPNGGTMKLRLGITAPLTLISADTGCLPWPSFVERNFTVPEQFQHSLWMESDQAVETVGGKLITEPGKRGGRALRGKLRDTDLCAPVNTMRVRRTAEARQAWTSDAREGDGQIIWQTLVEKTVTPPKRVILVVDGTQGIETYARSISAALSKLPEEIDFALLLARDGCEDWIPLQKGSLDLYQRVALWKLRCVGGHDNVPALLRAWDLAAQAKAGAIVWVHGPQPMSLASAEELRQRFERSSDPPLLFDVQTHAGPDRVLEKLDGIKAVQPVTRLGELGDDLGRLFGAWNGKASAFELARERVMPQPAEAQHPGKQTSMHLARLWAAEEISRLSDVHHPDAAMELATRYQLVTPVSGAVVLETKAQFERAGLHPVPAESVPAVPEPSSVLLGLVALLGLAAGRALRRRDEASRPR